MAFYIFPRHHITYEDLWNKNHYFTTPKSQDMALLHFQPISRALIKI
jgi:hypothetical protein